MENGKCDQHHHALSLPLLHVTSTTSRLDSSDLLLSSRAVSNCVQISSPVTAAIQDPRPVGRSCKTGMYLATQNGSVQLSSRAERLQIIMVREIGSYLLLSEQPLLMRLSRSPVEL